MKDSSMPVLHLGAKERRLDRYKRTDRAAFALVASLDDGSLDELWLLGTLVVRGDDPAHALVTKHVHNDICGQERE